MNSELGVYQCIACMAQVAAFVTSLCTSNKREAVGDLEEEVKKTITWPCFAFGVMLCMRCVPIILLSVALYLARGGAGAARIHTYIQQSRVDTQLSREHQ